MKQILQDVDICKLTLIIGWLLRISTKEQNLDLQIDALQKEGCEKIFYESVSSLKAERAELDKILEQARDGDIIVIGNWTVLADPSNIW